MEQSKRKRGRKTKKAVAETMDFQMAASGAPSPSALDEPQEIPDSASPKPRRGRGRPKKATRRQNLAPADSPASSPIRRGSQVVAINGEHGESGLAVVSLDPPPRWDQVVRVVPSMDAVVKVFCVHTEPNFSLPWQRKRQYSSSSSGFIIGGRRVLTNAHSVEHYTQVKLKKRGSDTKYVATVLAIGTECDIGKISRLSFMTPHWLYLFSLLELVVPGLQRLKKRTDSFGFFLTAAMLTVDNDEFWEGVSPVEFGSLPALQDAVTVVGYPIGGDTISVTSGVVSRMEILSYVHGSTELLGLQVWKLKLGLVFLSKASPFQIDAAINSGNSGGPAFNDKGKCVGIAFQSLKHEDVENIGYVIPTPVIMHFINDYEKSGEYTGT
ncbi:hypothetical protein B296_00045116 [Ensete ventricosum]|uniref:Peptidase S1 domain-containing protein n=1 Tax=Ensete ventricosum TaxID=4639 RepID=A0A426YUX6_ENSVE|nr:hypothetical protein B296_00045116 [Ensete ventricosum]